MKSLNNVFLVLVTFILFSLTTMAQENWPKLITASDGSSIKIYQPQPESFIGNTLKFRAPFSLQNTNEDEPQFGTFWSIATVQTNRDNRTIEITSIKIPNLKLPTDSDANHLNYLKTTLEVNIPSADFILPLDYVSSSLENYSEEKKLSQKLNNQAPKIIYTNKPSILVVIDGTPKLEMNNDWGLQTIVNTPFTIVTYANQYYLYGNKQWYVANTATGNYQLVNNLPTALNKVQTSINAIASTDDDAGYTSKNEAGVSNITFPVSIVVSTVPAELVQTNGDVELATIDGTGLSYIKNSSNDLFFNNGDQQYYLLLSGRWYKAASLNQNWQYIEASSLPRDFALIPEGSPKDNVLASVPGSDAAREAVIDAQIPQIAKVDRANAKANVTYDGQPQFKEIEGTSMEYATNTTSSILKYRGMYYCVENGVWFQSFNANGPWEVCTQRPEEVDLIPPSNQLYQVKYVYIYDVNPQYVYMGYTSGYLNNYIYGGRVVYGTGYYYNPWRGAFYYPRVHTWGFGMRYNPWLGWSIGYDYGFGWFNMGFGRSYWNRGYYGGWWGPSCYHPPFGWHRGFTEHGLYGRPTNYNREGLYGRNMHSFNKNYTGNIYSFRKDVITTNNHYNIHNNNSVNNGGIRNNSYNNNNHMVTGGVKAPPAQMHQNVSPNKVLTDRDGNVFKKDENGQWQQHNNHQWTPVTNQPPKVSQNLEQQQHRIERGQDRAQSFQNFRGNEGHSNNNSNNGGNRGNTGGFKGGSGSGKSNEGGGRSGRH